MPVWRWKQDTGITQMERTRMELGPGDLEMAGPLAARRDVCNVWSAECDPCNRPNASFAAALLFIGRLGGRDWHGKWTE